MRRSLFIAVRIRARGMCEYCHLPDRASPLKFHIDHIVSQKLRGATDISNLAYACTHCNLAKGAIISGIDPLSNSLTLLYNPRRHKWTRHFRWKRFELVGRTPEGRLTVQVLNINDVDFVRLRTQLHAEGGFEF